MACLRYNLTMSETPSHESGESENQQGMTRRNFGRALLAGAAGALLFKSRDALAHAGCVDEDPHFTKLAETKERLEIGSLDPVIDPVYATDRNFTEAPIEGYENHEIWLPRNVVEKLPQATKVLHRELQRLGLPADEAAKFRLLIKDGYRPHRATHAMAKWAQENGVSSAYVAANISGHNSGRTVDLTLGYQRDDGSVQEVWMGATFDEFSRNARHSTAGRNLNPEVDTDLSFQRTGYRNVDGVSTLNLREALKSAMQSVGATPYNAEYWHYSFEKGRCYDKAIG